MPFKFRVFDNNINGRICCFGWPRSFLYYQGTIFVINLNLIFIPVSEKKGLKLITNTFKNVYRKKKKIFTFRGILHKLEDGKFLSRITKVKAAKIESCDERIFKKNAKSRHWTKTPFCVAKVFVKVRTLDCECFFDHGLLLFREAPRSFRKFTFVLSILDYLRAQKEKRLFYSGKHCLCSINFGSSSSQLMDVRFGYRLRKIDNNCEIVAPELALIFKA